MLFDQLSELHKKVYIKNQNILISKNMYVIIK